MTIEIRELIIEARVPARDESSSFNAPLLDENEFIQKVSQQVLSQLRDEIWEKK